MACQPCLNVTPVTARVTAAHSPLPARQPRSSPGRSTHRGLSSGQKQLPQGLCSMSFSGASTTSCAPSAVEQVVSEGPETNRRKQSASHARWGSRPEETLPLINPLTKGEPSCLQRMCSCFQHLGTLHKCRIRSPPLLSQITSDRIQTCRTTTP